MFDICHSSGSLANALILQQKNKNGLHLLQIDPIVEHTFIQINYCIHGNIYINKAIETEGQS
jgi:hypothetical protein